jgi:hypothetical protein
VGADPALDKELKSLDKLIKPKTSYKNKEWKFTLYGNLQETLIATLIQNETWKVLAKTSIHNNSHILIERSLTTPKFVWYFEYKGDIKILGIKGDF